MDELQKDLLKGSAVQILNEISIEYNFWLPTYIVKSLGIHTELPLFQASCEIFKNNVKFSCIGEPAPQKKSAKQKSATKILEMLTTKFIFLEDIP